MKLWIRYWWPAIVMMILIFIASGTSGGKLPGFGHWDLFVKKGGHLTGYALLAAALLYGLTGGRGGSGRQAALAVVLAALYAVTDEFHQRFTPGRSPAIADVGIDTLGASIGLLVWSWLRRARATGVDRDDAAPQP
jgi:VanZ family protein